MTVKQLKKILAKCPDDAPVMVTIRRTGAYRSREMWNACATTAAMTPSGTIAIANHEIKTL